MGRGGPQGGDRAAGLERDPANIGKKRPDFAGPFMRLANELVADTIFADHHAAARRYVLLTYDTALTGGIRVVIAPVRITPAETRADTTPTGPTCTPTPVPVSTRPELSRCRNRGCRQSGCRRDCDKEFFLYVLLSLPKEETHERQQRSEVPVRNTSLITRRIHGAFVAAVGLQTPNARRVIPLLRLQSRNLHHLLPQHGSLAAKALRLFRRAGQKPRAGGKEALLHRLVGGDLLLSGREPVDDRRAASPAGNT